MAQQHYSPPRRKIQHLTLDERTIRYRHILEISNCSTQAVAQGLKQLHALYGERSKCIFGSITSDNGSCRERRSYYAHPYSPQGRGLNEKQNSRIRRFFSKASLEKPSVMPTQIRECVERPLTQRK